jgi:hypothetical protein
MAASYPQLLAGGVADAGRFDQFDLYAGESDLVSDQAQAADGVAIRQFEVLMMDANGRLTPWDATEFGYASGTVTFTGQPANNDTVTINGVVITFKTSGATGAQVNIGATAGATVTNFVNLINGTPDSTNDTTGLTVEGNDPLAGTGVTATVDATGLIVTLHAVAPGTAGNSITLTEAATNVTVSGATLAGGAAETDTAVKRACGIAAQPIAAATPGAYLPYFTGGVFNHEALVWPAAVATLGQRKRAFEGSNIGVRQLL